MQKGVNFIEKQDTMNIHAEINWIKSELDKVKDPSLIEVFKSLLNYRSKVTSQDWWETLSEEEKSEIEEGIKQADNGELIPHKQVMDNPKKWL